MIFNGKGAIEFIEALTGSNCQSPITFSASLYRTGDFSFPHTDAFGKRTVSFVWHLTRNWQENWGGGLFWCGTMKWIPPMYNTLHLFKVTKSSFHFVGQVLPNATEKRLAINGWWSSVKIEHDGKRRDTKIDRLDKAGRVLSHSGIYW